jgi:hypothetical protein
MENYIWEILILIILAAAVYLVSRNYGNNNTDFQARMEADAKRFARLLVAEIKLYNDYKLQRGLANHNLYESLQDEIETARKQYRKQVYQANLAKYFDETLVEVLADGDISKMGAGFTLPEPSKTMN